METYQIPQLTPVLNENEIKKMLSDLSENVNGGSAAGSVLQNNTDVIIQIPDIEQYKSYRRFSAVMSLRSFFVSQLNKGLPMPIHLIETDLELESGEYKWLVNLFKRKGYSIIKLRKPTFDDCLKYISMDITPEDIENESKTKEVYDNATKLEKIENNIVYELKIEIDVNYTSNDEEKNDIIPQDIYLKKRAETIYNFIKKNISYMLMRGEKLPLFMLGPLINDNDWDRFYQEFFEKGYIVDKPRKPTQEEYRKFVVERLVPKTANIGSEETKTMLLSGIQNAGELNWVCYYVSEKK